MKLLAFDTSTDALSMAVSRLVDGEVRVWHSSGPGGAQASGSLIGGLMDLLRQADVRLAELDAICFGSGPGSFTGLRTACSVAQGMACGADVPVLPVPSLLALAQAARAEAAPQATQGQVTALLDARMEEIYAATYAFAGDQWTALQAPCLVAPPDLAPWALPAPGDGGWHAWAGNALGVYADRLALPPSVPGVAALPTAQAMLQLAPALLAAGHAVPASQALPLYVRDKVAKTTAERAVEKADKESRQAAQPGPGAHA
ncbi:MAG: tRNA (adenosine(37)-N6)-threonylcarbamoyltransferase complex dimerization subunit type 1 TsaB [Rhodoferax sp.]